MPAPRRPADALPPEEDGPGRKMSFMEHLMELRRRLIVAIAAVTVTTILCFVFFHEIFAFLQGPMNGVNDSFRNNPDLQQLLIDRGIPADEPVIKPISTQPLGLMMVLMKISVWAGLVLSSPIVVYELWAFIAPGLKPREVRAIRPILLAGLLFFLAGASLCYFVVFPITMEFLVWFDVYLGVKPLYTVKDYIDLLTTFMLIFGLMFELPLVATVLSMLRILNPSWLTRYWRLVVVGCFLAGSILSPGSEIMSMLIMSGCLLFLYLLAIVMTRMVYPKDPAPAA